MEKPEKEEENQLYPGRSAFHPNIFPTPNSPGSTIENKKAICASGVIGFFGVSVSFVPSAWWIVISSFVW